MVGMKMPARAVYGQRKVYGRVPSVEEIQGYACC